MLENFYKLKIRKNQFINCKLLQYVEQFIIDINDRVEKLNTLYSDRNEYSKLYLKHFSDNYIQIYRCDKDGCVIYLAKLRFNFNTIDIQAWDGHDLISSDSDKELVTTEKEVIDALVYILEN